MLTNQVSMMPINACRESQKWLHGPHASLLNSIVAFHYCKMAALETPSRNRKRQRFLFDDIESDVLSEEDDNVLIGAPPGQLICFDNCATTKPDVHEDQAELANATAMHSEMNSDVLGEGSNCFNEGNEVDTDPVVSSEENLCAVSSASESGADLTFVQQANILQSMINGIVDTFPDLNFAMATGGEQPLLQISQRQLHSHPPFPHLVWFLVCRLLCSTTFTLPML